MTDYPSESPEPVEDFLSLIPTGALLEVLPIGLYACDSEGRIIFFNRRAAEIWGTSPQLGDNVARFCGAHRLRSPDGEIVPHADSPMAQVLQDRTAFRDGKVLIEQPNGTLITALVNIDPVYEADGTFRGAVNCFQDISSVEQAHENVVRKERELEDTLAVLPAAIYRTDADGRITFYNDTARELAGRKPELGVDRWCVSWRLRTPDGLELPLDECPMAVALRTQEPIFGQEIILERPDGGQIPCLAYPTPLFSDGKMIGAVNMLVDITERKRAEEHQVLLINELNHRVKNTLAMVQSIASQTLRRSSEPKAFVASLSGRIQAFARAHNMLIQGPNGTQLQQLIDDQVMFGGKNEDRVICKGPTVFLEPQLALHLALVLYELGLNARQHGSLSTPGGQVLVDWRVDEDNQSRNLHLSWREVGGPKISADQSSGFGRALIEKSLRSHGAEAHMRFEPGGLVFSINLPLPRFVPGASFTNPLDINAPRPHLQPADLLEGKRVLIIEDEPLVALDIENMLGENGCKTLGPANTVESALEHVALGGFDMALLDANLQGEGVDEVAEALTRSGASFAFVTGYGRDGLPEGFRQAPMVSKPFSEESLIACISEVIHARTSKAGPATNPPVAI